MIDATDKTKDKEREGEWKLWSFGMESCINDKLIFELRVKVVKKHAIWISGITAIGTEKKKILENIPDIMKKQQNQWRWNRVNKGESKGDEGRVITAQARLWWVRYVAWLLFWLIWGTTAVFWPEMLYDLICFLKRQSWVFHFCYDWVVPTGPHPS